MLIKYHKQVEHYVGCLCNMLLPWKQAVNFERNTSDLFRDALPLVRCAPAMSLAEGPLLLTNQYIYVLNVINGHLRNRFIYLLQLTHFRAQIHLWLFQTSVVIMAAARTPPFTTWMSHCIISSWSASGRCIWVSLNQIGNSLIWTWQCLSAWGNTRNHRLSWCLTMLVMLGVNVKQTVHWWCFHVCGSTICSHQP